jgi:hypothetical protein
VIAAPRTPTSLRSPTPRPQQAADLAGRLMSRSVRGLLVDCISSQAYDLRAAISRRLTAGESVDAAAAGDARVLAQLDDELRDLD